jgi:hypothetical protein
MITIYWGVDTNHSPEGIRVDAPISILQKMSQERIPKDLVNEVQYNRCPAFVDELKNLYGMKSYYDYTLKFGKDNTSSSPDNDQEFYDKHVITKSFKGNLFEFHEDLFFFTDEPSLEMSLLPAYLEDNSVVNNTIMVPGKIDIGKYFRGLQFAFHMKHNCNELIFSRKEIFFYIKFHTKKKLQFKQFLWTPKIDETYWLMMSAKKAKYDIMNLDYYYNIFERFNFKKKILKIIKENLCKEV